ncbi:hypothetical protein PV326_007571 [Microctonus aethiopoides]|nr:hypothetical protein PV326_007571 [Microctonus aethiopoides]
MNIWLLACKLPDTIMILPEECICFLSSKKKIEWLRELEKQNPDYTGVPPVKLFVHNKDDEDEANITKILKIIKKSKKGKIIGVFLHEICGDPFVFAGKAALDPKYFDQIDVSVVVAYIICPKENVELKKIEIACTLTMNIFNVLLKHHIMRITNDHEKIQHAQLSRKVESIAQIERRKADLSYSPKTLCYPAIIQSGGTIANPKSCVR